MDPMAAAQRYFAAWNRRDPEALVAAFAPGGTYSDPATGGELAGQAIGAYAGGLFAAFPDLQFELVSAASAGEDVVAAEWVMRGTNSRPFGYNPPTGRTIALPGADVITVADGAVRSVRGYFDMSAFVTQLGLHAMLAPAIIHPVTEAPPEAAAEDMGAYIPALGEGRRGNLYRVCSPGRRSAHRVAADHTPRQGALAGSAGPLRRGCAERRLNA